MATSGAGPLFGPYHFDSVCFKSRGSSRCDLKCGSRCPFSFSGSGTFREFRDTPWWTRTFVWCVLPSNPRRRVALWRLPGEGDRRSRRDAQFFPLWQEERGVICPDLAFVGPPFLWQQVSGGGRCPGRIGIWRDEAVDLVR